MLDIERPLEFFCSALNIPRVKASLLCIRDAETDYPLHFLVESMEAGFIGFRFFADLRGNGPYKGKIACVRNVPVLHECYGPDLRCGSLGSGELRLTVPAKAAFPGAEWSFGERTFKVAYCPFCGLKAT